MNDHHRADDISLREHFEALLMAEAAVTRARFDAMDKALLLQAQAVESKMGTEVAVIKARFDAMDKALVLQAEAVGIHLDKLNGEQTRLAADRERFLPRELHEAFLADFRKWQDVVNAQMAVTTGRDRGVSLAWSVGIAVIGIAVAIAGTFFAIFSRASG